MNNISIGDEVIVHEPSDHSEYPTWGPAMNKYIGKIMLVKSVDKFDKTVRLCCADPFYFNINWLERVATDDDFDTEIGSLYR